MYEREAHRFPASSVAGPNGEVRPDYTERLRQLEQESRPLDLDAGERLFLRDKVLAHADGYMAGLDRRPVYDASDDERGALYDSPISEEPMDPDAVLELLDRGVNGSGVTIGSAGHMAYIPGSNLHASALADYLGAVLNKYAGLSFASPGMVRMERMLLRWVADFVGYPQTAAGDLTSGGSIANLVGIVTAREASGLKAKDFGRAVVYLSAQTHHAVDKALRIAGLGESVKRFVRGVLARRKAR